MPDNWIGHIKLTNEDYLTVDSGHQYEYISCEQGDYVFVEQADHPVLYSILHKIQIIVSQRIATAYRGGINWEDTLYDHAEDRTKFSQVYDRGLNLELFNGQYGYPVAGVSGTKTLREVDINLCGLAYRMYAYAAGSTGSTFEADTEVEWRNASGESVLRVQLLNYRGNKTTKAYIKGVEVLSQTEPSVSIYVTFSIEDSSVQVSNVTLQNVDFTEITNMYCSCYATSTTHSTTAHTSISFIDVVLPTVPNMPRPEGSPNPYKILADLPQT